MDCAFEEFPVRLTAENHTLKRSLTDPHILSDIGNAYSDELLHHAQLSPVMLSQKLTPTELARLLDAIRDRLNYFTCFLRRQTGAGFPEKITAFLPEMAAHGKFNQPWRALPHSHATNCPRFPRNQLLPVLADRSLSRLLGRD